MPLFKLTSFTLACSSVFVLPQNTILAHPAFSLSVTPDSSKSALALSATDEHLRPAWDLGVRVLGKRLLILMGGQSGSQAKHNRA